MANCARLGRQLFPSAKVRCGCEAVQQDAHAEIAGDNNYRDYQEKNNLPKLHAAFSATACIGFHRGKVATKSE